MELETLEIEIGPDGDVRVHVKGRKGPRCMDYKDVFKEILGPIKSTQTTDEYYEQDVNETCSQSTSSRRRE